MSDSKDMADTNDTLVDDDDLIDGCDLDFTEDPDDDETAALRPLFPEGVASDKWEGVFDA